MATTMLNGNKDPKEEGQMAAQNQQLMDQLQTLTSEMKAMRLEMEEPAKTTDVPQKGHVDHKIGASDDNPADVENDLDTLIILPNNSTIGSCQDNFCSA